MGLIRIKSSYRKIAGSTRHHDPKTPTFHRNSAAMLAHGYSWAKDNGYRIRKKTSFLGSRFSKMTTTYYKEIRVGYQWDSYSRVSKAMIMMHEIVHARQWRYYGRGTFATKYVFNTQFRWAMEVQAYRESLIALKALGATRSYLEKYAKSIVPGILWKNYMLRSLRKSDVYKYTAQILLRELD
jgi:hypothetical protein